jgi:hypothetical protein
MMLVTALVTAGIVQGGTVFRNLPPDHSDRSTAEYILRHAAPGDALVFTCLTRTPADYYFRRFGSAKRFVETSFPQELDEHPGWRDNTAMLRHSDALESEASALAARLAQFTRSGRRVWVYYGQDLEVADILKQKLDASLLPVGQKLMRGPCHNFVLAYAASQAILPVNRGGGSEQLY